MKKNMPFTKPRTIVPTYSRPTLDPDALSADLGADITVGGISCIVLFKFVTTLQVCTMHLYMSEVVWTIYIRMYVSR